MPLPFTIGSPATVDFSDYKNSFQAVYNALTSIWNTVSDGSLVLGDANEYLSLKFEDATELGNLVKVYVHADKVGSPTFNVSANLYADNGSGEPDLNNKLSSGVTVAASSFPTTARLVQFTFLLPYSLVASTLYHIVFKASAQGNSGNNIRFYKDSGGTLSLGGSNANTGMRAFGSSTWSFPGTADILRCAIMIESGRLWAVALDKTNNKIRMHRSTDSGATWAESNSATAPSCSTTSGLKSVNVVEALDSGYQPIVLIASNTGTTDATCSTHRILPGIPVSWGSDSGGTLNGINTDVASNRPRGFGKRFNGDNLFSSQGATETVMGNPRRRVKMTIFTAATLVDVVGTANSPLANTLPGTAVDHEHRLGFMDMEDRYHVFLSFSDTNNIKHRVFHGDNTASTTNEIGSTPAVCSNTSAYPIGLGCNYYKNNEWRIAIMYLDSTSGTIKVAHCKAADSATASSWTIEQISTDTPEVTTSNMGFLSADSQQSGQLIAAYIKSDDTIWRTQDQGNGNWITPVQVRSGQSVQGISGFLTAQNLNFMYLDTTPTPDELKFDRL